VPCRCRPARIGKLPPHPQSRLSFTFGQVYILVAEKRDGRKSIGLGTKQCVMLQSPCVQGCEKMLICELGERLTPIVPNGGRLRTCICDQSQQMGSEVIATPPKELLQQVTRPIGSVIFQTVTKHCVGRMVAE